MIRGIHHFGTELNPKIDVIPRGCFDIQAKTWGNRQILAFLTKKTERKELKVVRNQRNKTRTADVGSLKC